MIIRCGGGLKTDLAIFRILFAAILARLVTGVLQHVFHFESEPISYRQVV
jgi:hypothetical protein